MHGQAVVMEILQASLVRPVALAVVAWLLLRAFRVRHPASQHAIWSFVLAAMLVLPVASRLAPRWNVAVMPSPAVRATTLTASPLAPSSLAVRRSESPRDPSSTAFLRVLPDSPVAQVATRPAAAPPRARNFTLGALLWICYLAGLLGMALYRFAGWTMLRRLIARSKPTSWTDVRESNQVFAPVAAGFLRPVVILPAEWREWDETTLRAVMTHERAHVTRRDGLMLAFGGLMKTLYWFHPLTWLLARRVNETAELACDAAVLEQGADAEGYTRILLGFSEVVSRTGRRAAMPELAMATRDLGRRVIQVFELSRGLAARTPQDSLRRFSRPGVVLALAGVPALCLAATVTVGVRAKAMAKAVTQPRSAPIATTQAAIAAPLRTEMIVPTMPEAAVGAPPKNLSSPPSFQRVSILTSVGGLDYTLDTGDDDPVFQGGQVSYEGWTLMELISNAYNVRLDRVLGIGARTPNTAQYDIRAAAPADATPQAVQTMLQGLLADRFQVNAHFEDAQVQGYELVQANVSPHLTAAEAINPDSDSNCPSQPVTKTPAGTRMIGRVCKGESMAQFVRAMGGWAPGFLNDAEIHDATGLKGGFDFMLHWAPVTDLPKSGAAGADRDAVGFFDALERQLGLRLVPRQLAVPKLVVDRAVEPPSDAGEAASAMAPPAAFSSLALTAATGAQSGWNINNSGDVRFDNSVMTMIRFAYGLWTFDNPLGAPEWANNDRYSIRAKLAPGGSITAGLRDVLARRFHMAAHVEAEPADVLALVRGPEPLTLARATGGESPARCTVKSDQGSRTLTCREMSTAEFALALYDYFRASTNGRIMDFTGLDGAYDFTFTFTPPPTSPTDKAAPADGFDLLSRALEAQLGLRLERQTHRVPVLVIDHIERTPAGN